MRDRGFTIVEAVVSTLLAFVLIGMGFLAIHWGPKIYMIMDTLLNRAAKL